MQRSALIIALCLLTLLASRATLVAKTPTGVVFTGDAGNTIITVDWCHYVRSKANQSTDVCLSLPTPESNHLIRSGSSVFLHIRSFNFIRYSAELSLETEECAACETLAGLWKGIFNFPGISFTVSGAQFWPALLRWRTMVISTTTNFQDNVLDATHYEEEYLTKATLENTKDYAGILQDIETVEGYQKALLVQRGVVFGLITSRDEFEVAVALEEGAHASFMQSAQNFLQLARHSVSGQRKDIRTLAEAPIKPNSFVTVSFGSVDRDGNATGTSDSVSYFLQSRIPVRAHFGGAFSGLDDNSFEPTSLFGVFDVFTQVREDSEQQDFVAFLSYEWPMKKNPEGAAWQATLGTGFSDPGETIYVGGGIRFLKRLVVTAGLAFGKVTEGVTPLPVFEEDLEKLFLNFAERNEEEFFFAVSIVVR